MPKTALITGASSGFGKIFAYELAKKDFSLVLIARREDRLEAIKEDIEKTFDVSVQHLAKDLSSIENTKEVFETFKDVDIVINSAGFGVIGDLYQISLEKEQEMIDLNVKALHYLTKAYGLEMSRRKAGGIINIASTASFISMPNFNVYAATKAFVLSFTEAISKELQKENVHVMALCPGPSYTEFFDVEKMNELNKRAQNIPFMMKPERVVREAIHAFEKKKRICIPGMRNKILNFFYKIIPRETTLTILYRFMKVKN